MIYKSYFIEDNINLADKNLFLFYGENIGLKDEFKKKIKLANQNSQIININQDDILKNESLFFNQFYNISLFDEQKVWFVNNSNDKILNTIKELETKIDKQKLYFFSEILDKKSKIRNYFEKSKKIGIVPCYKDNEIGIRKIILEKLKGFKGLTQQNINIIIENCNLDRIKLRNELDKIIALFSNKELNTEKIEKILNLRTNDNFNLLKDEALIGNKIMTNKLLGDTQLENEKNILYLSVINQRLNKLFETSKMMKKTNLENAMSEIKPPIFWKDKPIFISQVKKWNENKIKEILEKTYKLEIKIKSNSYINKNVLIKKLMLDICELANAS
jgi:DNA polymerase III subunit delta